MEKRQGTGAVQDAGANDSGSREREASWTAVALYRFDEGVARQTISRNTGAWPLTAPARADGVRQAGWDVRVLAATFISN
jgi:hypothetical protein